MRNSVCKIMSLISYIMCLLLWILVVVPKTINCVRISNLGIVLMLSMCAAPLLAAFIFELMLNISVKKKYYLNKCFLATFILLYINFLIIILFTSRSSLLLGDPIYEYINIIPLKTISNYFNMLINHNINLSYFINNIFSNILLFIPLSFAIFCIFNNITKSYVNILICCFIIIIVEFIQAATHRGFGDIDDLILGILGVLISYAIFKNSFIQKLMKKLSIIL